MEFNNFETKNVIMEKPNNYMALSIVSTILSVCSIWCLGLILGIIAIVMSSQSTSKYNNGDYNGSVKSAKVAKILGIISLALTVIGLIAYYVYFQEVGGVEGFKELMEQAIEEANNQ